MGQYEFGGPPGVAAIMVGFPLFFFAFFFACNDVAGCPAPILLNPGQLSWTQLKTQIPWPEDGLGGFVNLKVVSWLLAYYMFSLVLHAALPAQVARGTKLRESGQSLEYRFNAFSATVVHLIICAIGTYIYGASFAVWTYIADNYLQILTCDILLSFAISIWVYLRSFGVKRGNAELRELAVGGNTGNIVYDFFIGRELNPRVVVPLVGEVDVKAWLEMRPGLTGWLLLDLTFIAKQYRNYGSISNSILLVTAVQAYYVLEGQYFEDGLLPMMDITTDGLGFMLSFGDIVIVPFLYSTQCRYLAIHPVHLDNSALFGLAIVFVIGLFIFRSSNAQKLRFRTNPTHPSVKDLPYIQTKRGTRLLTGGWWGMSRHMNYLGDWIQSMPFSLPTAIAGYIILPASKDISSIPEAVRMADGRVVIPGEAKGWGMIFTYAYVAWFAILLVHRQGRDDVACAEKYGEDWIRYKKIVRWRIVPGIY